MNGKKGLAGAAATLIALIIGGFQVWGYLERILENRRITIERLNDYEQRLCRLEGGRWRKGECHYRHE